jgi:hypothetical protein
MSYNYYNNLVSNNASHNALMNQIASDNMRNTQNQMNYTNMISQNYSHRYQSEYQQQQYKKNNERTEKKRSENQNIEDNQKMCEELKELERNELEQKELEMKEKKRLEQEMIDINISKEKFKKTLETVFIQPNIPGLADCIRENQLYANKEYLSNHAERYGKKHRKKLTREDHIHNRKLNKQKHKKEPLKKHIQDEMKQIMIKEEITKNVDPDPVEIKQTMYRNENKQNISASNIKNNAEQTNLCSCTLL